MENAPPAAGLGDVIRDLFDFESWAPRSSQAWRLGQQPIIRGSTPATNQITQSDLSVLNRRLADTRSSTGEGSSDAPAEVASGSGRDALDAPQPSFVASTDSDLASALGQRIVEIEGGEDEDDRERLTGEALKNLIYVKYGKMHDVAFVRRDIPGKTIVSLNVYHAHMAQRSFPMTEEEYAEKLDGIASLLEAWGQAGTVVTFLQGPITPRRGLPSRPVIGSAVAITLDMSAAQVLEWFGR